MDRLLFLFHTHHKKDTYIQLHQHKCYELVYYFGGSGNTRIGMSNFAFKPHTFALISPHTPHDEKHTSDSELLFIGFLCEQEEAIRNLNKVIEDDDKHTIQQLILRMEYEFTSQQEGYYEMLNLLVSELTTQIQRLVGLNKHLQPDEGRLKYAINYMDEHFQQKISGESLASMSGYSYERFRHLFKETTGVSPQHYLLRKRLDHAKSLLLHTEMTISQVANDSGFVKDSQFSAVFKRETGVTPMAFRKQPSL
jgi:AraC-like DNA-binding protein